VAGGGHGLRVDLGGKDLAAHDGHAQLALLGNVLLEDHRAQLQAVERREILLGDRVRGHLLAVDAVHADELLVHLRDEPVRALAEEATHRRGIVGHQGARKLEPRLDGEAMLAKLVIRSVAVRDRIELKRVDDRAHRVDDRRGFAPHHRLDIGRHRRQLVRGVDGLEPDRVERVELERVAGALEDAARPGGALPDR
jgi:hypothetical protein